MSGGFTHERSVRGATNDWITPREITAALGDFDLDPCACEPMPWSHAAQQYTVAEDGLRQPWRGRVWLNPPYGPDAQRWLARLADHGDGIAFVFARTETRWFFRYAWERADALLFIRGRVRFCRPDGSIGTQPPAPSALIAYGQRNAEALRTSGLDGAYVAANLTGLYIASPPPVATPTADAPLSAVEPQHTSSPQLPQHCSAAGVATGGGEDQLTNNNEGRK